jgi:hypothetical protein
VRMQRKPATAALEVRMALLMEKSSLGAPGARQLRARGRLARDSTGVGREAADQLELLTMIGEVLCAAEC